MCEEGGQGAASAAASMWVRQDPAHLAAAFRIAALPPALPPCPQLLCCAGGVSFAQLYSGMDLTWPDAAEADLLACKEVRASGPGAEAVAKQRGQRAPPGGARTTCGLPGDLCCTAAPAAPATPAAPSLCPLRIKSQCTAALPVGRPFSCACETLQIARLFTQLARHQALMPNVWQAGLQRMMHLALIVRSDVRVRVGSEAGAPVIEPPGWGVLRGAADDLLAALGTEPESMVPWCAGRAGCGAKGRLWPARAALYRCLQSHGADGEKRGRHYRLCDAISLANNTCAPVERCACLCKRAGLAVAFCCSIVV